jgi:hypothetical protein
MQVYPHEAWCPRCSVSHPPGTKRCLHCDGAVLPMRPIETGGRTFATSLPSSIEIPPMPEPDEPAGRSAPPTRVVSPARLGLNVFWLLLVIAVTLVRVCSERG